MFIATHKGKYRDLNPSVKFFINYFLQHHPTTLVAYKPIHV